MTDLDLRTAVWLTAVLVGMMSLVLFLLRNSYPPYVRGITHWASALAIFLLLAYCFQSGAFGRISSRFLLPI